jgi:hypothetical protein
MGEKCKMLSSIATWGLFVLASSGAVVIYCRDIRLKERWRLSRNDFDIDPGYHRRDLV